MAARPAVCCPSSAVFRRSPPKGCGSGRYAGCPAQTRGWASPASTSIRPPAGSPKQAAHAGRFPTAGAGYAAAAGLPPTQKAVYGRPARPTTCYRSVLLGSTVGYVLATISGFPFSWSSTATFCATAVCSATKSRLGYAPFLAERRPTYGFCFAVCGGWYVTRRGCQPDAAIPAPTRLWSFRPFRGFTVLSAPASRPETHKAAISLST